MHASDAARAIEEMVYRDITESFALVTDENIRIDEIVKIALRATDSEHLGVVYDSSKPNGQHRKDLSTEKMKRLLPDFKPMSLERGIRITYLKYKKYRDGKI